MLGGLGLLRFGLRLNIQIRACLAEVSPPVLVGVRLGFVVAELRLGACGEPQASLHLVW